MGGSSSLECLPEEGVAVGSPVGYGAVPVPVG